MLVTLYQRYEFICSLEREYGEDYEAQDWYDPMETMLMEFMKEATNPWNYGPGETSKVSVNISAIAAVLAERIKDKV